MAIKKETAEIIKRIEALEFIVTNMDTLNCKQEELMYYSIYRTMIEEYRARYDHLTSPKEFMVHFKGGGWNTCYGVDKEDAFERAKSEFDSMEIVSVSLSSPQRYNSQLNLQS